MLSNDGVLAIGKTNTSQQVDGIPVKKKKKLDILAIIFFMPNCSVFAIKLRAIVIFVTLSR